VGGAVAPNHNMVDALLIQLFLLLLLLLLLLRPKKRVIRDLWICIHCSQTGQAVCKEKVR